MNDKLNPDIKPNAEGNKVRRVNNLPIYIIVGIFAIFILIVGSVAMTKGNKNSENAEREKPLGDSKMMAMEIAGDREGGVIGATKSMIASEPVFIEQEASDGYVSQPSMIETDQELEQIKQAKAQMFQNALAAKTEVNKGLPGTSSSEGDVIVQSNSIIDRMQNLQSKLQLNGSSEEKEQVLATYQDKLNTINNGSSNTENPTIYRKVTSSENRWYLGSKVHNPSLLQIRSGAVIPAVLLGAINSDLAGQIRGQITQNIYDTATGRILLIPQGSQLFGYYDNKISYGQKRVLVAWQRIIFPDGRAFDIGEMPGADSLGRAGLNDQVNNHYWRLFGTALLMSAITGGVSYATDRNSNNDDDNKSLNSSMTDALGNVFGQAVAQLISKNLNISPTLEIRPGFRFNVIVVKDMELNKPYSPYRY